MAEMIHTIKIIPPEINQEIRSAFAEGKLLHIELQEIAENKREKKEKRKTIFKAIIKI